MEHKSGQWHLPYLQRYAFVIALQYPYILTCFGEDIYHLHHFLCFGSQHTCEKGDELLTKAHVIMTL